MDTADIFKEINKKRKQSVSRPTSANGSLSSKILCYFLTFICMYCIISDRVIYARRESEDISQLGGENIDFDLAVVSWKRILLIRWIIV